jgi:RNA-directed DNA polymerase
MKRHAHLMPRICTWENLAQAFHKAAAGKRRSAAVIRFEANLPHELNTLVGELESGIWQPGAFHRFLVRDPKLRVIHAAPFRDRVVHHALMNVAGPCFEQGAVSHSYACRTGRGNVAAVEHAAACTRKFRHFLKLDVRRYFDSIPHDMLRGLFRRRFKDGAFLAVLEQVISSFMAGIRAIPGPSETTRGRNAPATRSYGLPIGTLTSQYFANFYLDGLDHWIMETLRCPAYVRYMDDLVLWHDDPTVLDGWLGEIQDWLMTQRGLELKGNPGSAPCAEGLPFLGYRLLPGRVLLGRTARRRFRLRLRGYEMDHAAGLLPMADLQRRADALLAFTEVARCRHWRRRTLATLPLAGETCPS